MDLAKKFKKYSRSHAFFYVTLDPERALGLEDVLPNYTIICPYKSRLAEGLQKKSSNVVVLEDIIGEKELSAAVRKGTYGILQLPFVQKHIEKIYDRGKSVYVLVLKNSELIEDFCIKQGWHLLAPKAKIAEQFENKISQYKLLKNIVPYPDTVISTVKNVCIWDKAGNFFRSAQGGDLFNPPIILANDSPLKSRKKLPALSGLKTFVLQFNRGHSGNSTFFITSKTDLERLYKLYPNRECKVSQFIKGKTYTLNCLMLKNGKVITGSISEQITGLKAATNNPNTTCGNDFMTPRKLGKLEIGEIAKTAQKVGRILHKSKYRGLFGIDAIIEDSTRKMYFIELNTHQPASISFEAKLHRKIGKVPLMAYFILDHVRAGIQAKKAEMPPILLPIFAKQILYRNKTSKVLSSEFIAKKYTGKGICARLRYIKPNEEIYRRQIMRLSS